MPVLALGMDGYLGWGLDNISRPGDTGRAVWKLSAVESGYPKPAAGELFPSALGP